MEQFKSKFVILSTNKFEMTWTLISLEHKFLICMLFQYILILHEFSKTNPSEIIFKASLLITTLTYLCIK